MEPPERDSQASGLAYSGEQVIPCGRERYLGRLRGIVMDPRNVSRPSASAEGPSVNRRLPNLLLAGMGRAGSSSMFWYLSQHPDVCASRVKEPRYFLPLSEADSDAEGVCPPIHEYTQLFKHCRSQSYRMEGTPHYFHGGQRLIREIRGVLPDPRILLTLRDPVQRTWSVYRLAKSILQLPNSLTFEEYLRTCERLYEDRAPRTKDNRPYWSIRGGVYADFLPDWLNAFGDDRLRILFFENFIADPAASVADVCRWLGIDDSCVTSFNYSVENRSAPYRNRLLQRVALAANSERLLRNRRRLKAPLRRVYQAINARSGEERMPPAIRLHLQELFQEPNARLAALLSERGYMNLPAWLQPTPGSGSELPEASRD
jgi:hypothetical protein